MIDVPRVLFLKNGANGSGMMNGAESLVRTLVAGGVDVWFANPGSSEMHFVAALDRVEGMRCVLGLFEGVVTGAADGYFRMRGTPASTLLHLGPGLANGLPNLHNPKKPNSAIFNILRHHPVYHIGFNPPVRALTERGLGRAAQIAGKAGWKGLGQPYNPRMARGRGRLSIDRIPYVIEQALPILKDFRHIVLVEGNDPVAFFAYPNKPSMLKPDGCEVHRMTSGGENSVAALEALASALGARPADAKPQALVELAKPTGALTHASIAQAIAMAIPENAIVVDESITTGRGFFPPTAVAKPHDWLQNMGGSIGFSTPVATGAAVAGPDRKVICMVGDGSAMYTLQSLWTQAREGLNVLTIVFANRIYQILRGEFDGVGAGEPGTRAQDMLKIDRPTLDFVSLAKGMGVPGRAVANVDDFNKAVAEAIAEPGPRLIEVQM